MNFKYIFFDLDGTLTDPYEGLSTSVIYALSRLGIIEKDLSKINRFIGPPLVVSFMEFYGLTREKAEMAIGYYREVYAETGIYQNRVYEGIEALLEKLKNQGRTICMATSKPTVYANIVAKHFKLDDYFEHVEGAPLNHSDIDKAVLIENIIEKYSIKNKNECVMIGDRCFDINAAKKAGIASIGITYGYGDAKELQEAGADYIISSAEQLNRFFDTV